MASYRIEFRAPAEKDLRRVASDQLPRVVAAITALGNAPRPPSVRKLAGASDAYRVRSGDYRVIYHIDDVRKCLTVERVRHRRDVCRD